MLLVTDCSHNMRMPTGILAYRMGYIRILIMKLYSMHDVSLLIHSNSRNYCLKEFLFNLVYRTKNIIRLKLEKGNQNNYNN